MRRAIIPPTFVNGNDEITKEEGLGVSLVDERRGHRYLKTRQSYSSNRGGRGHISFETIHYSYCNLGRYHSTDVDIDGSMSQ